jgi:membrane protein YdbS with pleckstrin-like domain
VHFSTGQLIFAACFVVAFIAAMVWSYARDKKMNKVHYRKVYMILVGIIVIFSILYAIIKMRSKFM